MEALQSAVPRIALTRDELDWWARRKSGSPALQLSVPFRSPFLQWGGGLSAAAAGGDTVSSILGSLLFADYYAADRDNPAAVNPRISLSGSTVTSWPEEATRNVALTATGDSTLSATSFGGKPGITDPRLSIATLSPTIATGSRMYMWVVGNWTTTTLPTAFGGIAEVGGFPSGTTINGLLLIYGQQSDTTVKSAHNVSGGNSTVTGGAMVTTRLVYESGFLSSTTAQLVVGGTSYNGSLTAASGGAFNRMNVGWRQYADLSDNYYSPFVVHRVVVAHDTANITSLPSASQLTSMRALLGAAL